MKIDKNMKLLFGVVTLATLTLTAGCAGVTQASEGQAADLRIGATRDDGSVITSEYHHLANINNVETVLGSAEGLVSTPWVIIESHPTMATLFIAYVGATEVDGTCTQHVGSTFQETETSVVIASLSETRSGDSCAGDEIEGGSFDLSAPLGDRQILHAKLSEPWKGEESPLPTREGPQYTSPVAAKGSPAQFDTTATCDNLISKETREGITKSGAKFAESYPEALWQAEEQPARPFLEYGGIACFWALGNDPAAVYLYGTLSSSEEAEQIALFKERGYAQVESAIGDGWTDDYTGYGTFLLGDGYWVFATNGEYGNRDSDFGLKLAVEVATNAPAF